MEASALHDLLWVRQAGSPFSEHLQYVSTEGHECREQEAADWRRELWADHGCLNAEVQDFEEIWSISDLWTVVDLSDIIELLETDKFYSDDMLYTLVSSQTTQYVLDGSEKEI